MGGSGSPDEPGPPEEEAPEGLAEALRWEEAGRAPGSGLQKAVSVVSAAEGSRHAGGTRWRVSRSPGGSRPSRVRRAAAAPVSHSRGAGRGPGFCGFVMEEPRWL